MKEFNYAEAMKGRPVITRCGYQVRGISEESDYYGKTSLRVLVILPNGEKESFNVDYDGRRYSSNEDEFDLFMAETDEYVPMNHEAFQFIQDDNMRPFNASEARAHKPVCTRSGYRARIFSFTVDNKDYPIIAGVRGSNGKDEEEIYVYTAEGEFVKDSKIKGSPHPLDLMMVTGEHHKYANYYDAGNGRKMMELFDSKSDARKNIRNDENLTFLYTTNVKWGGV